MGVTMGMGPEVPVVRGMVVGMGETGTGTTGETGMLLVGGTTGETGETGGGTTMAEEVVGGRGRVAGVLRR